MIYAIILAWLLLITVLLPFVRHDYWIFRICEYPRYQKLLLCLLFIGILLAFGNYNSLLHHITLYLMVLSAGYLLYQIWPYLPLGQKEVISIPSGNKNEQIRIYTCNVLQDNRDYSRVKAQVEQLKPDLIFLLETDEGWHQAVHQDWGERYPHTLLAPKDNTYGLLLYSKLPFQRAAIQYLVEEEVPSVDLVVELPCGQPVQIWGLHPKPPVPGEDDRSTAKDKELMKIALKAEKSELPVIVMGDLNDVAWSYVTDLFRKTSQLLDPRRGRGFYSTFSANYWFMRFPLDYIFCSADFALIAMKRMPHVGSDHFPMFIELAYRPSLEAVQEAPTADPEEKQEAVEKANAAID